MQRLLRWAGLILGAGVLSVAQPLAPEAPGADKTQAYYNYTLAHLYANMSFEVTDGGEYIDKTIAAYKAAIAADPRSAVIAEELSDYYIQFNRLPQARSEAEDAIRRNPNDIAAHRLLGRIYVRLISPGQNQQIDQNMFRKALEEYQKITELDPRDVDALVFLARLQRAASDLDGAAKSYDRALELDPTNEDALTGRATIHSDRGENQKALDLYQRAAEINPSSASWQRLAAAYEQLKEYDLAAETMKKAVAMSTDSDNTSMLERALAQALWNAGKFDEAADEYVAIAAEDPKDAEPWLRISQLRMQKGELDKAREAHNKAKALDPDNVLVQLNESTLLQAEGKPRDAVSALRKILETTARPRYTAELRSGRLELLDRLAGLQRNLNLPGEAVDSYREMIDLDSSQGPALSAQIIDTYREGKRLDDAQREAAAARLKYPDDNDIRVAKAFVDAEVGKAPGAAADIKKMLGGPNDRGVQIILGQIYEKGKLYGDAGKALDEAEKLSTTPQDRMAVWFMHGALFEKMNNLPLAEGEFRKVLGVAPEHAGALNYLGYMLTDRNVRINEALGLIERAIKQDPNNGAYLDSLGWVYYRMGRYADAEVQLQRALDLSPGDPTMQDHYAEVLMQQKKVKEAVQAWEEALREWQASSPAEKDESAIDKVKGKLDRARKQLR